MKHAVLSLTLLLAFAVSANAQLTRDEAIQVLEREVNMTSDHPAWSPFIDFGAGSGFEGLLPSGATIGPVFLNTPPYTGSTMAAGDSYVFLIDDEPNAQWAHNVRYAVIDASQEFDTATAVSSGQGWWLEIDDGGTLSEHFQAGTSDSPAGPSNPDGLVRGIAPPTTPTLPPPSPGVPAAIKPFRGDPCAILFSGDNDNTFNDDVDRFEQQMKDRGMPDGRIKSKKGGTLQDLKDLVTGICNLNDPKCDKIFVYIGAHGHQNGLGFQGATNADRCVTEAELVDALCPLEDKGAKLCILIQACHSGSLTDGVGDKLKGASIFTSASAALTSYGTTYYDSPSGTPGRVCLGCFSVFSNGFSNCWDEEAADKNEPKNGTDWEEAFEWLCDKDPTVYDSWDCPDTPKERNPQHPDPQYSGSVWVNSWTCKPGEDITIQVHGTVDPADKPVTFCVSNGRTGLQANTPVGGTDNTDLDNVNTDPHPVAPMSDGRFWSSFTATCPQNGQEGELAVYKVVLKIDGHTVDVDYGCVSIVAQDPDTGIAPPSVVPEPPSSETQSNQTTQSRFVILNENPFATVYDVELNAFNHYDSAVAVLEGAAGFASVSGKLTATISGQTDVVAPFAPYEVIVDVTPVAEFTALSGFTVDLAVFDTAAPVAINASATVLSSFAECFLLVGNHAGAYGLSAEEDQLLVDPLLVLPITAGNVPTVELPGHPSFDGMHFCAQVYMNNPGAFPDDPIKLSNGLDITMGSNAAPVPFGSSSHINLWGVQGTPLGGELKVQLAIRGMYVR